MARPTLPDTASTARARHQRVLRPGPDSTPADLRLTVIVFSVAALLSVLDLITVRSGNAVVFALVVLAYSFFRAFQGWNRLLVRST